MQVYFDKVNCRKELLRAIVRKKRIIALLPDCEMHGNVSEAHVRSVLTHDVVKEWKLDKKLKEWAKDWAELDGLGASFDPEKVWIPTGREIADAIFEYPPLEWSRVGSFQDITMRMMGTTICHEEGLLRTGKAIYLKGESSQQKAKLHQLTKGRLFDLYCSPHCPGAADVAEELRVFTTGAKKRRLLVTENVVRVRESKQRVESECGERVRRASVEGECRERARRESECIESSKITGR